MDPKLDEGEFTAQPGYWATSDKRAIDTIGWLINIPGAPQPPLPDLPDQPPNGQQRVGFTPTLQWMPGTGSVTHNLYVFSGTTPSSATEAYRAVGLIGSSHAVPYGILEESTTYSWRVTAFNVMGFAIGPAWTFTTRCYADCNADGTLTSADFGCFQTQFVVGDPQADCNRDLQLTIADFGCFQTKFVAGCP